MLKTVLVVDDSKFSRKNSIMLLEKMEYEIIGEAVDGLDGLQKYKELQPDLVISDLEMPNLDGVGMIKEIKSYDSKAKIIVISSIVNSQVIQEVIKLQASVVQKPIKEHRLLNAIKLLDR